VLHWHRSRLQVTCRTMGRDDGTWSVSPSRTGRRWHNSSTRAASPANASCVVDWWTTWFHSYKAAMNRRWGCLGRMCPALVILFFSLSLFCNASPNCFCPQPITIFFLQTRFFVYSLLVWQFTIIQCMFTLWKFLFWGPKSDSFFCRQLSQGTCFRQCVSKEALLRVQWLSIIISLTVVTNGIDWCTLVLMIVVYDMCLGSAMKIKNSGNTFSKKSSNNNKI